MLRRSLANNIVTTFLRYGLTTFLKGLLRRLPLRADLSLPPILLVLNPA